MIRSKMLATSSAIVVACFLTAGGAYATDPDAALRAMKSQVYSTGPNGEKASPASEVTLTPEELAKVKDKHATAALVFHYGGNDWSNAQLAALECDRHPIIIFDRANAVNAADTGDDDDIAPG